LGFAYTTLGIMRVSKTSIYYNDQEFSLVNMKEVILLLLMIGTSVTSFFSVFIFYKIWDCRNEIELTKLNPGSPRRYSIQTNTFTRRINLMDHKKDCLGERFLPEVGEHPKEEDEFFNDTDSSFEDEDDEFEDDEEEIEEEWEDEEEKELEKEAGSHHLSSGNTSEEEI
jgi:hypothetical protein